MNSSQEKNITNKAKHLQTELTAKFNFYTLCK